MLRIHRDGGDRPQHLDLLVAQGVGFERRRRLHGDEADQLEEVVLQDVARRPGLLVERAATLDADRFRHRDLDVIHVASIPERLEDPVAEPEDQQVADGLLAQVVVDAIDLRLAEDLADLAIQTLGRLEVVAERLLDDDPAPAAVVALVIEADAPKAGDQAGELRRLHGEIEEVVPAGPVRLVDGLEMRGEALETAGIVEVELVVDDPLGERRPGGLIERQDAAVHLEGRTDLGPVRLVLVGTPADGEQDELVREQVRSPQLVDGRDDLSVGEVAGRPEQDHD